MNENELNYTNQTNTDEEIKQDSVVPPKNNKKILRITAISAVILILIVITGNIISHIQSELRLKKYYLEKAEKQFSKITSDIADENYYSAISDMKDYVKAYSAKDKYYSSLPDKLKPQKILSDLKPQIVNELVDKSNDLYTKMASKNEIKVSDYDNVVKLEDLLDTLISNYDYLTSNIAKTDIDINALKHRLADCKYTKARLMYSKNDKSGAIAIVENLIKSGDLESAKKTEYTNMLNWMKSNGRAKNFKIVRGSSEVSVYTSGKNFAWKCPYCGYVSEAVGTASISSELKNHYAGETSTYNGVMMCAGKLKGGCGRTSSYTLTIQYE